MIERITPTEADDLIRASWPARRQDIDYTLHTAECGDCGNAGDEDDDDSAGLILLGAMLGGTIVGVIALVVFL